MCSPAAILVNADIVSPWLPVWIDLDLDLVADEIAVVDLHVSLEVIANGLFGDVFKDWELPAAVFERDATSHEKYAFKDFFHDGSVSGHKAGEVKEDEVAKFIKHLCRFFHNGHI